MSRYDAIVVGSGPNGLSAAIVLARAGLSVLLREANETIGGGTRSLELTRPGFVHDVCSAVHPMAVASPLFRSLPLPEFGLQWINPPIAIAHPLDNAPPACLALSMQETGATLQRDSAAWRYLFAPLVRRWDQLIPEILAPAIHVPGHPFAMAAFGMCALWPASALARTVFRGEHARALFAGLAAHSIVALEELATSAIGLVLGTAGHAAGWPIPEVAPNKLPTLSPPAFARSEGTLETGAEVEVLESLPSARAVLLDLTPRQVIRVGGGRLPADYLRNLGRYAYGPGIFKIDWALSEPIPWKDPDCRRTATVHLGEYTPGNRSQRKRRVEGPPFGKAVRASGTAESVRFVARSGRSPYGLGLLPCAEWLHARYDGGYRVAGRPLRSRLSRYNSRAVHQELRATGTIEQQPRRRRHRWGSQQPGPTACPPGDGGGPVPNACRRLVSMFGLNAARWWGARHVRIPRGTFRFEEYLSFETGVKKNAY